MVYKKVVLTVSLLLSRFTDAKEFSLRQLHCIEEEGRLVCSIFSKEQLALFLKRLSTQERTAFLKCQESIEQIKQESRRILSDLVKQNKLLEKAYQQWYGSKTHRFGIECYFTDQDCHHIRTDAPVSLPYFLQDPDMQRFYDSLSTQEQVAFAHLTAQLSVLSSNSTAKIRALLDQTADIQRGYMAISRAKSIVFNLEFLDRKIAIGQWA